LRERPEDVPALIEHFLARYRERFNRPALDLSEEARRRLESYDWPGNVRELRNLLERAAALAAGDQIEADQILPAHGAGAADAAATANSSPDTQTSAPQPPATLEELERQHILRVLQETGGNRERASAVLGISARTLYRKLREYETDAAPGALATED
jgi:DNA-binding NtrC family response regulator